MTISELLNEINEGGHFSFVATTPEFVVLKSSITTFCVFCSHWGDEIKEYVKSRPEQKLILLVEGGSCWTHTYPIYGLVWMGDKCKTEVVMTEEEVQKYFFLGQKRGAEQVVIDYCLQTSKQATFAGAIEVLE